MVNILCRLICLVVMDLNTIQSNELKCLVMILYLGNWFAMCVLKNRLCLKAMETKSEPRKTEIGGV